MLYMLTLPNYNIFISKKTAFTFSIAVLALFNSACTSTNTTSVKKYELGELTKAESAQLISKQYVKLSSWSPLVKNKSGRVILRSGDNVGITYFVKIDRTGETLAISQKDDFQISNGNSVWVQFGDKVRVYPK